MSITRRVFMGCESVGADDTGQLQLLLSFHSSPCLHGLGGVPSLPAIPGHAFTIDLSYPPQARQTPCSTPLTQTVSTSIATGRLDLSITLALRVRDSPHSTFWLVHQALPSLYSNITEEFLDFPSGRLSSRHSKHLLLRQLRHT